MNDYESVIDQIQAVLAWDHDPDPDYMETLANDYTRLVKEVNERLRACDKLLSRGLRTEAIQQAESEPNLLDITAVLDFPEAEYWSDYVSQYEMPPIPELLVNIAADLNDAYAAEQPVARLLKLHRLHALALSPLSDRILILRTLADIDRDNAHWLEDLERFEDARLTQIEEELEEAFQAKDAGRIAVIDQELSADEWHMRPPKALRSKVRSAHNRLRSHAAKKQVRQVAEELIAAFEESDESRTRDCAERWEEVVSMADLSGEDPILAEVMPALSWVAAQNTREAGQKAYDDSVAALQKAIKRNAPMQKLERLAQSAQEFDLGLPEEVQDQLEDRYTKHRREESRRKMLMIGGIAAGVVFFVIVVALLVMVVMAPPLEEPAEDDALGHSGKPISSMRLVETQAAMGAAREPSFNYCQRRAV